jgi:hypothetical protein
MTEDCKMSQALEAWVLVMDGKSILYGSPFWFVKDMNGWHSLAYLPRY